jgi:hypothetical protein
LSSYWIWLLALFAGCSSSARSAIGMVLLAGGWVAAGLLATSCAPSSCVLVAGLLKMDFSHMVRLPSSQKDNTCSFL